MLSIIGAFALIGVVCFCGLRCQARGERLRRTTIEQYSMRDHQPLADEQRSLRQPSTRDLQPSSSTLTTTTTMLPPNNADYASLNAVARPISNTGTIRMLLVEICFLFDLLSLEYKKLEMSGKPTNNDYALLPRVVGNYHVPGAAVAARSNVANAEYTYITSGNTSTSSSTQSSSNYATPMSLHGGYTNLHV